ncbi:MAG: LasR-specific antiactivator QslA [Pseudomonadota bacterium]
MADAAFAILPAADGQPAVTTRWPARYQEAVEGAARVVEQWLVNVDAPLINVLQHYRSSIPPHAFEPFEAAFFLRLEQRLRSQLLIPGNLTQALALGNGLTISLRLSLADTLRLADSGELRATSDAAGQHLAELAVLGQMISLPLAPFTLPKDGRHD